MQVAENRSITIHFCAIIFSKAPVTAVALPFSTCSVPIQNFEVKFYHFWLQRILIVFRMHHRTPAYLLDMSELENVFEIVFPKGFACFSTTAWWIRCFTLLECCRHGLSYRLKLGSYSLQLCIDGEANDVWVRPVITS